MLQHNLLNEYQYFAALNEIWEILLLSLAKEQANCVVFAHQKFV